MANPILTDAGRAYVAAQDAADLPVVLAEFRLGNPDVGGAAPGDPPASQTAQAGVVWSGAPTAEGIDPANPDSVIYSLLLGTDVGDFEVTQVGLWSDTGVLVYLANIPTFYKRAAGAGQLGNNFAFNANIVYAGIVGLTGMQAPAETWQQDFTALLAAKENVASKGLPGGYAGLDAGGTVPDAQLSATIQRTAEKGQPGGYAGLGNDGRVKPPLLHPVVVGSAADVAAGRATHTIGELDDVVVPVGTRVVLLAGTHALTAALALTHDDVTIIAESPEAIIELGAYDLTLSGARCFARIRLDNSGVGQVHVTGSTSVVEILEHGPGSVPAVTSNGAQWVRPGWADGEIQHALGQTDALFGASLDKHNVGYLADAIAGLARKATRYGFAKLAATYAGALTTNAAICRMGPDTLAVICDGTNTLGMYKVDWRAGTISLIGSTSAISHDRLSGICRISDTMVAIALGNSGGGNTCSLYTFGGSTWTQTAAPIASGIGWKRAALAPISYAGGLATVMIAGDDEAGNAHIRVMDWSSGFSWNVDTGGPEQDFSGGQVSISTLRVHPTISVADIALLDNANLTLQVRRCPTVPSGPAGYQQLGNSYSLAGISGQVAIAALNESDVAVADETANTIFVLRWDGQDFTLVSELSTVPVGMGAPALCAMSGSDIVLYDAALGDLRAFHLDASCGWPHIGTR